MTEQPPEPSEPPITFSVVGDVPVIEPDDYGAAYLLPGAAIVEVLGDASSELRLVRAEAASRGG